MRKKNVSGDRQRFHFSLDPSHPRDKIIGDWLNHQYNASESVKSLIAAVVMGQSAGMTTVPISFNEVGTPQVDKNDPRAQALLGMET